MPATAPSSALVEISGLSKRFGGLLAVDKVHFSIFDKHITALIGPNGAGKTTVFNCLTGFYRPSAGTITARFKGNEINLARLSPDQVANRAGLARTFQNIRLFRRLSVLENLLAAQHRQLMRASGFIIGGMLDTFVWQWAEADAVEKARFWLSELGILNHANDMAGSLPYGVQRRVEIARALCMDPQLLCLDEPAAGLNPRESANLAFFLQRLRDQYRLSVLLIEHDMSVVMNISDHVVVLDHGQKIAEGPAQEVRGNPDVIKAYLGEDDDDA